MKHFKDILIVIYVIRKNNKKALLKYTRIDYMNTTYCDCDLCDKEEKQKGTIKVHKNRLQEYNIL